MKSSETTIPVQLSSIHAESEKKSGPIPAPLNPDKRIGYALVGLGHLTLEELLPAFSSCKYSKPIALVSGDADKAKKVATQYGISEKNIYNYENYDSIKDNPEINAVYIVLPNGMHEEYTLRAAAAGKHVLCEKPMANNSRQAQNMIDACKKAGKKLMVAYRIQYEPHNRLAQKWVREKKFGAIKLIESVNAQNIGDPKQWRLNKNLAGGGTLPDIGIYCLNTIRFLLGEEPEQVLASSYTTPGDPRFKEVEEAVLFQLRFPSGALANCSTSYGVHQTRRYRCYGDKGGYFGLDPAFAYERLQMEGAYAEGEQEIKISPELSEKNQFALEIDHFSECIMENKQPYTPGEEGLQDHKIMEAIYESAQAGKIVKLNNVDKMDAFRGTPPKLA
jgi:predicted dehydrogenase